MSSFKRSIGISFQVMNWAIRSMDIFFLTPKEQMLKRQLTARVKASGKAQRACPIPLPRESQITMAARPEHR